MPTVSSMCVPRASNFNTSSAQGLRLIEITNSTEPEELRRLAIETLMSALQLSHHDVVDMALDNPYGFIQNVRETMERDARTQVPLSVPRNPPSGSQTQAQTELFEPQTASQARTSDSHSGVSVTPGGLDTQIFEGLPDNVRAELLSWLPLDLPLLQGAPAEGTQSVSRTDRPAPQPTSASSSSQDAAGEQVEEVSWPRIHEWLQSRTGPRPLVLCVWCQEQVIISDGDLQPEDGVREPSYQLPCSHIVGQRCLRNSLEHFDVRVTRCPFCRADIGNVYE